LTRMSMEINGELCRSLLHSRYGTPVSISGPDRRCPPA
jgi:hypothetical protein